MPDFDVEAFVVRLERLGVKLTAVPLADGKVRINRWRMLNAGDHAQQIEDLWNLQIGENQAHVDLLAAYLNRNAPPVTAHRFNVSRPAEPAKSGPAAAAPTPQPIALRNGSAQPAPAAPKSAVPAPAKAVPPAAARTAPPPLTLSAQRTPSAPLQPKPNGAVVPGTPARPFVPPSSGAIKPAVPPAVTPLQRTMPPKSPVAPPAAKPSPSQTAVAARPPIGQGAPTLQKPNSAPAAPVASRVSGLATSPTMPRPVPPAVPSKLASPPSGGLQRVK